MIKNIIIRSGLLVRMAMCLCAVGLTPVFQGTLSGQSFGTMPDARHMFVMRPDGILLAWGRGSDGNLGRGDVLDQDTVVFVFKGQYAGATYLGDASTNGIKDATGNPFSSGALANDGLAYTWGNNSGGQMGDNTTANRSTPVKVWKGQYTGTTYLGDASTNKMTRIRAGSSTTAGHAFMLALGQDGLVYAWGYNNAGQLGDNTRTNRSTPVRVRAGQYGSGRTYLGDMTTNKIIAIGASEDGYSVALAQDGSVYSWGTTGLGACGSGGTDGRLGTGGAASVSTPVRVRAGQYGSARTYLGDMSTNKVISISTGGSAVSAVTQLSEVYIWGGGCAGTQGAGKLGNNTQQSSSIPIRVLKGNYNGTTYFGDNTANPLVKLVMGGRSMVALMKNDEVYSWGENSSGQVGDGSITVRSVPTRVLSGLYPGTTYFGDNASDTVVDVTASERNVYAVTQSGRVYSVGNDPNAELGDCAVHTPTYLSTPVRVKGGIVSSSCQDLILPITLTSFEAEFKGRTVDIEWHTAAEINAYAYEIERLIGFDDGQPWERVGVVGAQGTTSRSTTYKLTDNVSKLLPYAPMYVHYRLRCIDLDGSITMTDPRKVRIWPYAESVSLDVIEKRREYEIKYSLPNEGKVLLQIFDVNGRLMQTLIDREQSPGIHEEEIEPDGLTAGVYLVQLQYRNTRLSKPLHVSW